MPALPIYISNLEQSKELATKVANWLNSPSVFDNINHEVKAVPVMVTIGKYSYFGARYRASHQTSSECNYYLVGRLTDTVKKPFGSTSHYWPKRNIAYSSDKHAMALSGGSSVTEETCADPRYAQYHPFGVWFILTTYPDDILTNDRTGEPYPRKPIQIVDLA